LAEEEMPPGVIGEALVQEIMEKAAEWREQFVQWQGPFTISLLETCSAPTWDEKRWLAPPIVLKWERLTVKIVGEIKNGSMGGLLCLNDDNIEGLMKVWPEVLAAAMVLEKPAVVMVKAGKVKPVENAEAQMKFFLEYYFRCLKAPSPLIPGWIDPLLRKGPSDLEQKMRARDRFEDGVKEWVVARTEIPEAEEIFDEWGSCLTEAFSGLISMYPTRKKGVDATV
jgi:hypothetical protein